MMAEQKLKKWQSELDQLTKMTGISLEQVCDYLDLNYQSEIGFYVKLPRKRTTFIGIGMAFRQPLDVINRWLKYYAGKRQLYSKDILEDLIWIYLIQANVSRPDGRNYFRLFSACQEEAYRTYEKIWSGITANGMETADVDRDLSEVPYDDRFYGLKLFIVEHMEGFTTAYSKPRRMLSEYVESILATKAKDTRSKDRASLGSLRGFLDDSMINYLSGAWGNINVCNPRTGKYSAGIKHVPKSRRSHLSLCLALGMGREEIDEYLHLMGFSPLNDNDIQENTLIRMLGQLDELQPLVKQYKAKYIQKTDDREMPVEEELQAAGEMLSRRQVLSEAYAKRKMSFPYMKG